MKRLVYKTKGYTSVYNPETEEIEQQLCPAEIIIENASAGDIERASEVAYNGEYAVEDVDAPDAQTLEDRVGALEGDTAELAEALDLLLSEVTE